jgi:hypothetical protein
MTYFLEAKCEGLRCCQSYAAQVQLPQNGRGTLGIKHQNIIVAIGRPEVESSFLGSTKRGAQFRAGDEERDVTTIAGPNYSTIALTAKRVANKLNAKSEDPAPQHA